MEFLAEYGSLNNDDVTFPQTSQDFDTVGSKENEHPNRQKSRIGNAALRVTYEGFDFVYSDSKELKDGSNSVYYTCCNQKYGKCYTRVTMKAMNDGFRLKTIKSGGDHSSLCVQKNDIKKLGKMNIDLQNIQRTANVLNLTEIMKSVATEKATAATHISKSANIIAKEIINDFDNEYSSVMTTQLQLHQLVNIVNSVRSKEYTDVTQLIESAPMRNCIGDMTNIQSFLRFNLSFVNQDGEQDRIIGWGNPKIHHEVINKEPNLFTDCTFACVPAGFAQCMIVMGYLSNYNIYVPLYFILLKNKMASSYSRAFNEIIADCQFQLFSKSNTCDFEKEIIAGFKDHFREGTFVGCEFHWKQCLLRKLLELHIPLDIISNLIDSNGLINLLPEVEPTVKEVQKCIEYIRSKFERADNVKDTMKVYGKKFDEFWCIYFLKTWVNGHYLITDWSIYGLANDDNDILINRTNNPLERFNRELNSKFQADGHPNMKQFVTTINQICFEKLQQMKRIRNRTEKKPKNRIVTVYYLTLPEDYVKFIYTQPVLTA